MLRARESLGNWASALLLCAVPLHATAAAAQEEDFLSAEQARLGASIIADGFALSGAWLGSEYPDPEAEEITTADIDLWVSVRLAVAAQSLSDAGVQLAQALPSNNTMVARTAKSLIDASVGCKLAAEAIQTGEFAQAAKWIETMLVGLRGTGTLRPLDSKARIHRVVSELESIARTLRSRGENIDEIASGVAQACKFAIAGGAPVKSAVEEIQGLSATELAIADIDPKRIEQLFAIHEQEGALASLTEIANNPVPHVDYLLAVSVHIGLHELSSDLQELASMLTSCVDGDDDETDCPHLCDDHVFQVSALGMGMGGVTNGLLMNPDEIEEICEVADLLVFLNDYAQQAAVKSALKGRARDLFDKLNFQDPPERRPEARRRRLQEDQPAVLHQDRLSVLRTRNVLGLALLLHPVLHEHRAPQPSGGPDLRLDPAQGALDRVRSAARLDLGPPVATVESAGPRDREGAEGVHGVQAVRREVN